MSNLLGDYQSMTNYTSNMYVHVWIDIYIYTYLYIRVDLLGLETQQQPTCLQWFLADRVEVFIYPLLLVVVMGWVVHQSHVGKPGIEESLVSCIEATYRRLMMGHWHWSYREFWATVVGVIGNFTRSFTRSSPVNHFWHSWCVCVCELLVRKGTCQGRKLAAGCQTLDMAVVSLHLSKFSLEHKEVLNKHG